MAVVLLSLTGIPPTAGALNSVISLFYYFRLGKAMFMEENPRLVR